MAKEHQNNKPWDVTQQGTASFRDLQAENARQFQGGAKELGLPSFRTTLPSALQYDYEGPEQSPLMQQTTRLGNRDYLGNSVWDSEEVTTDQLQNLSDIRAENQPWYSKLVNGIGKAGILAATTAAELGGLIYGLGQGAYNAYNEEGDAGDKAGAFLEGLWNNPITKALQTINEASEEYMPNYYTRDEQENPFGNIFTANFLGDKILKNLGFMVGAFYGGIPIAKGIGKIGTSAVKRARNALNAEMQGMGTAFRDITAGYSDDVIGKVGQYGRQIEGLSEAEAAKIGSQYGEDVTELYRKLSQRGLTESEKGKRMLAGLEKINEIANSTRATTQVLGALGSAINEGAIEAINNSKDWADGKIREENDRYAQRLAEIDAKYGGIETDDSLLEKEKESQIHEMTLAGIEEGRASVGNADLLMNIPILTYSNFLQLGKLYTRGFDTTRRRMGSLWNGHKLSGSAAEGTLKSDKTWKGGIARGFRNSLSEGAEEFLQRSASDAAGNVEMDSINASIDRFVHGGKSEESKTSIDDYIAGFAKAVADNAGNPQAWEEFMIGALSSMVGMPVFGSQTKNAYGFMKNNGVFGFAGGMVGSYEDYMAEKKRETDIANYLNDRVHGKDSQKFKALYDYLRKSEDYEQALMTALENNDKEEYKNLEAEKLFEDINAFASAGHLEEFKQLIGYNEDYDAAELEDIVKNTKRPVSASQQRDRDTDRLDAVITQLEELEYGPEYEDTSSIDAELDAIRRDIITQNKLLRRANDDDTKHNITQELSRLRDRQRELSEQRQNILSNNMRADSLRQRKEDLEKERTDLEGRLAGEYKDKDEGEFVQMVNGVPIGMNTIPDVDEEGNPIAGTEGNEMRRILDRNRNKLLKGINDYLRIRDNIDVETDGRLDDKSISLLTKMKMQTLDWESRTLDMASDLARGLKPIQEMHNKLKEEADDNVKNGQTVYTAAQKLLNEAKANKDVSPETIADLEKKVVEAEGMLNKAKNNATITNNAAAILGLLVDPIKTTRRERRALDKGYGKDEEGDTYRDLYDNSERNINSEEAQNLLSDPLNLRAFESIILNKENGLSDAERGRYLNEINSLHHLARSKNAYNEQLRKFIGNPTLINKAMADSELRMNQKDIDNKSDELSLRIRRARDMAELDSIMRSSQIMPEVASEALRKAKQDGDDTFKSLIEDYEKTKSFFDAFSDRMGQYPAWIQKEIQESASYAWDEALRDTTDASKYDKFIELLNNDAEALSTAGHKQQADTIKSIINDLQNAAAATATNSSSSVRSSSHSGNTSPGSNSPGSTGGTSGTGGVTGKPASYDKVLRQIDDTLGKALGRGVIIDNIDDLGPVAVTVKRYNAQNPSKQIDDAFIKQRVQELTDSALNEDKNDEDDGSVLSESDYESKKSSEMKGNLRVVFNGTGVTQYRIYEGEDNGILMESKDESYPRSEEAEAIHKLLSSKTDENPNGTGAYDFLAHNLLGYLNIATDDNTVIHFLRPSDPAVGNSVFLAIEWTPRVAGDIKRVGFGEKSGVTIPDTSIEAVDKDGNVKKYQIVGNLSVLSEKDGMDSGISTAFSEVMNAVNAEVNPILSDNDKNKGKQWAVSSLTSLIDKIYTGRLVKKTDRDDSADRKVGLNELVSESPEKDREKGFTFGVVAGGKCKVDPGFDKIVNPGNEWMNRHNKSNGAILVFLPKADGFCYPIRCTRRTVAEWYKDANGEALLNQVLEGKLVKGKSANDYLSDVVNTIKALLDSRGTLSTRMKGKMDLKKYFVLNSGGRKVSVSFDNDTVRISFDDSALHDHTIVVYDNHIDEAVKEFFGIMSSEGIKFSIPLPSEDPINGKDIITSGIFKVGLKDYYNFNPSLTVMPINKDGKIIKSEIPESEREYFAGSKRDSNSYVLNLGDGPFLYHFTNVSGSLEVYKSKVDSDGKPIGNVTRVTDVTEYNMMSIVYDIYNSTSNTHSLAFPVMLNALRPGENFKETREILKDILGDSWNDVYLIRTSDGVWYFDMHGRADDSGNKEKVKLFKQGTPLAEKLKKELEKDIDNHNAELIERLNASKPGPSGPASSPAAGGGGNAIQTYIDRMNAATTQDANDAAMNDGLKAGIPEKELMPAYRKNTKRIAEELKAKGGPAKVGGTSHLLSGKKLSDWKVTSKTPEIIKSLLDQAVSAVLGESLIETIYKDLQDIEAAGGNILDPKYVMKIEELRNLSKSKERKSAWNKFADENKCLR